jgi:hypothetical protein
MKVLYYCGIGGCERSGTLTVAPGDWEREVLETICPECGQVLRQSERHFENFNSKLHEERAAICRRAGPLTRAERERLRKIHELLGHSAPEEFTEEQASLVMKIASDAMQRLRNEEKN